MSKSGRFLSSTSHILLFAVLSACTVEGNIEPTLNPTEPATILSSSTPTKTKVSTPTITPTHQPSPTPVPIEYINLGPPFDSECGIPLIIADNSFNGPQGDFDSDHGHFDIWPSECAPDEFSGEVIAPISGILEKGSQSYRICLSEGTYIAGIENAMIFMGINNPQLSMIRNLCVDLGHLEILPEMYAGVEIQKGQTIGDLAYSHYPSPKLAYQINFSYGSKFYMASPTLFQHDVVYSVNFHIPETKIYKEIFANNLGPWICDFRMKEIIADWDDFYCYPEPLAYP